MANEISGKVLAQAPKAAVQSGQFVSSSSVNVPVDNGQNLPASGEALPQEAPKVSSSQLREAVDQINNFVQVVQRDLSFSVDEGSGKTIIRVVDSESGKLVRQIPSEEVLALATYLNGLNTENGSSAGVPEGILFSDNT